MTEPEASSENVARFRCSWSRRTAIVGGVAATVSLAWFLFSGEHTWAFLIFAATFGALAVQYARAEVVATHRGVSYRGIFRWWHLDWDRVIRFETIEWRSEGGASEHPVVEVASKRGGGRTHRRRMFALGAKSTRDEQWRCRLRSNAPISLR